MPILTFPLPADADAVLAFPLSPPPEPVSHPAPNVPLDNLGAFRSPAANWQLAGAIAVIRERKSRSARSLAPAR